MAEGQLAEASLKSTCGDWNRIDPYQQDVTRILKSFKKDLMGIIHISSDGILRSLTADRQILFAQGPSTPTLSTLLMNMTDVADPEQIRAFLDRMPEEHRAGFATADGTMTDKGTWFRAKADTLPSPLPQEMMDEARNMAKERKDVLKTSMEAYPN